MARDIKDRLPGKKEVINPQSDKEKRRGAPDGAPVNRDEPDAPLPPRRAQPDTVSGPRLR